MACLDDITLSALSRGEGTPETLEAVEAHVDSCANCRRAVAAALRTGARSSPSAPAAVGPGTAVSRYLIIERVGVGAMGQVFSAYDPKLDRKVALKLLRPGVSSPTQQERLAREAQTLARLSHPHVVTVFDVGSWEDQVFVALEFVAGGSAREWARKTARPWREVLALYLQAGEGLAAAHDAGVVHRDFKPDNVLVAADGRAQLTDFGFAGAVSDTDRLRTSTAGGHLLSASGAIIGTPAYMAPDQLEGVAATPASDQFSFSVALFEALCGVRPFEAERLEELVRRARAGEVRGWRAELPSALRRVLLRGLSAKPEDRFTSMRELLGALRQVSVRNRRLGWALGAASVLCVSAVGLALYADRPALHAACQLAQARHDALVSRERLDSVRSALVAGGASWAEPTWTLVAKAISDRSAPWRSQSDEACEALLTEAGANGPWAARLSCLEERWTELDATLEVLSSTGKDATDRAVRVLDRLPGPSACLHASVARDDPGALAVTQRAAKASALFELGKYKEAESASAPPLEDGGTEDARAPEIRFVHARALEELGRVDEAQQEFFAVGVEAARRDDRELEAKAWAELAQLVGYVRALPDEGEKWALQAEAIATASGDKLSLERITSIRGLIEARRGRPDRAEKFFKTVEELVRDRAGEQSPAHARALSNLAGAILHTGRVNDALPLLEATYRQLAASLGPEHPDVFVALNAWGAGLGQAGRLDEAAVVFQQAYDGYLKVLGPKNRRLAIAALNLAEAHARGGHPEKAAPGYQRAAELWIESLGPDAPQLAAAYGGLGQAQLDLHQADAAVRTLKQAVTICESKGCEPEDEAAVRFSLAKALRTTNAAWAECLKQAKLAASAMDRIGAPAASDKAAVQAWIAAEETSTRRR